ncbi:MAG TPA: hypothetical protein VII55_02740 [Candidatus Saccharimonadales bacterium]
MERWQNMQEAPSNRNRTMAHIFGSLQKFVQTISPLVILGETFKVVYDAKNYIPTIGAIDTLFETSIGVGAGLVALNSLEQYFNARADRQLDQSVVE